MARGYATPPEAIAEARRLFETTDLSRNRIAGLTGIGLTTLRDHAAGGGWVRPDGSRQEPSGREPPRQDVVAGLRERIEREIVAAEAAMDRAGERRIEGVERISRSLASLVRTLRELAKYDEEQALRAGRPGAADEAAHDDLSDLDAFRDALSERLERLRNERGA